MQTMQIVGILAVFFIGAGLAATKKVPTLLVLPAMAILMALIGGVPFFSTNKEDVTIFQNVLESGAIRLASTIAALFLTAWLGQVMNKTGITGTIIRRAAEFAGDRKTLLAIVFYIVASVIFAGISGLGPFILVGTIILPIMLSAGLSPLLGAIVILTAFATGGVFYLGNISLYQTVTKLDAATITQWSWVPLVANLIGSAAIIAYYLIKEKKMGKVTKAWSMPKDVKDQSQRNVRAIAMITPLIPVLLVLIPKFQIVPSVLIGILAGVILSTPKDAIKVLASGFIEGIQDVAGSAALMIGIGMLLASINTPQVGSALKPLIALLVPKNIIFFVLAFTVLSPLAVYRGPMNIYGMGSGVLALLLAGGMKPMLAVTAMRLEGLIQCVCDPTNTHNVWVGNFNKLDIGEILKKTLVWYVPAVFVGLIIAAVVLF